jgi:cysteine desulfurase
VIEALPPIIARLRTLSPYWSDHGPLTEPRTAFRPAYA